MTALLDAARDHAGTLTLLAAVWVVGYLLACMVWPNVACGHCEGGRKRSPSGRAWRSCRRCGGRGSKVRAGRRLWAAARAGAHRDR
jgi:hypothetical protein